MNKKILLSIMTIGLIAMLAGTGLYALYSDTETSEDNVITAATMNLRFDANPAGDTDDWVDDPDVPNLNDLPGTTYDAIVPGMYEYETIGILNEGNIEGKASICFTNVVDNDNGLEEPEPATGVDGDLSGALQIRLSYSDHSGDPHTYVTVRGWTYLIDLEDKITNAPETMVGGTTAGWFIEFRVLESVGNEIMGDTVSFDVVFGLTQAP